MIGIVVSRADRASEHIGDALLERGDWERLDGGHYRTEGFELRQYDGLHLHLEDIAADFEDPEFLVFVSRHSGETGALLSTHFTGNLGDAEYGGSDHQLAPACPNAQQDVLQSLDDHAPEGYDVTLECTHHGPSDPGAPSMFVELGSSQEQWDDPSGATAVASAVLELRDGGVHVDSDSHIDTDTDTARTFVTFGSGHYAPRPSRIVRDTAWACGHIAADWALDELGDPGEHADCIDQVFTESNAEYALIEGDRPALVETIETLGYRVVGETWLRETDRVPLDLVEDLEADLSRVDGGLRFGTHAETEGCSDERDATYTIIDLPADLLETANGIDMDAIRDATRSASVAFETRENGNRVSDTAAFPSDAEYDAFIDAVCRVLDQKYDAVEQTPEAVIVHERAFDPETASALGVPEGPKFGALAAGESVEIDGRTISPSDVSVDRTRRYSR